MTSLDVSFSRGLSAINLFITVPHIVATGKNTFGIIIKIVVSIVVVIYRSLV